MLHSFYYNISLDFVKFSKAREVNLFMSRIGELVFLILTYGKRAFIMILCKEEYYEKIL